MAAPIHIARLLKKGIEDYSRSEEGALFTFKWTNLKQTGRYMEDTISCPMHEEPLHLIPKEFESNEVHEVVIPSAGCMLISRKVFEKIRYELLDLNAIGFQDKSVRTGDDIGFILGAKKQGFQVFCHTGVKCEHLVKEKYISDCYFALFFPGALSWPQFRC
jgi:hypothetical protein